MKVFKNLFGNNSKINASEIAIKDSNDKIKILDELLKETILYENETGISSGTFSLKYDVSNYKRIKIFFRSNTNEQSSIEVLEPNGKLIQLINSHAGGTQYYFNIIITFLTLNGKNGTFSAGRELNISSNKTINSLIESYNNFVYKIVGYNY